MIRFWVFAHDWTRLTLGEGNTLAWHASNPTEEGWRSEWCEWHLCEGVVYYSYGSSERDCDGVMHRGGNMICPVGQLWERLSHDGTLLLPDWQEEFSFQRDMQAEAAGY